MPASQTATPRGKPTAGSVGADKVAQSISSTQSTPRRHKDVVDTTNESAVKPPEEDNDEKRPISSKEDDKQQKQEAVVADNDAAAASSSTDNSSKLRRRLRLPDSSPNTGENKDAVTADGDDDDSSAHAAEKSHAKAEEGGPSSSGLGRARELALEAIKECTDVKLLTKVAHMVKDASSPHPPSPLAPSKSPTALLVAAADGSGSPWSPLFSESSMRRRSLASIHSSRSMALDDATLRPFVSRLAIRTLDHQQNAAGSSTLVDEVVIMFVDISGYSKVTTVLAPRGAFALSEVVNGMFAKVLDVIGDWLGDVLNFAGDAVTVCFTGSKATLMAAGCAMELLRTCGRYPVPETELHFGLHIGIVKGDVASTLNHVHGARSMQQLYHTVSGAALRGIGDVVDSAKNGEVCVSDLVAAELETTLDDDVELTEVAVGDADSDKRTVVYRIEKIDIPDQIKHAVDDDDSLVFYPTEEQLLQFVHPAIATRLRHGYAVNQIAELRFLTVLFIALTDAENVSVRDWFQDVSAVLEHFQCPILQLIDDDKGVHVTAASSLVFIDREAAATAVRVAKALIDREVGCAIGIATGATFCGVVGSSDLSCRWDITGATVVRAARLMQAAQRTGKRHAVVCDESVYQFGDTTLLDPFEKLTLKGTPDPVQTYTISPYDCRVLNCFKPRYAVGRPTLPHLGESPLVHAGPVNQLDDLMIAPGKQRAVGIVHGPGGCGKTVAACRVAETAGFTLVVHHCAHNGPQGQLAATLGMWFGYHMCKETATAAQAVTDALEKNHLLRAMRLTHDLVNLNIQHGRRTALIVRSAQFVDEASLSLVNKLARTTCGGSGRFVVVFCTSPLHGLLSWRELANLGGGPNPAVVEIGPISRSEIYAIHASIGFAFASTRGDISLVKTRGITDLVAAVGRWLSGLRPFISKVDYFGIATLPPHAIELIDRCRFTTMDPATAAKVNQAFDMLSPALRAIVTCVAACVANKMIDASLGQVRSIFLRTSRNETEEKFDQYIQQLQALYFLYVDGTVESGGFCSFAHPATVDVVVEVTIPDRMKLLHRHIAESWYTFHAEGDPTSLLARAFHCHLAGNSAAALELGWRAWDAHRENRPNGAATKPMMVPRSWGESKLLPIVFSVENKFYELLEQLRVASGGGSAAGDELPVPDDRKGSAAVVLPQKSYYGFEPHEDMSGAILGAKNFVPFLSLGPIGDYLREIGWAVRQIYTLASHDKPIPDWYENELETCVTGYLTSLAWLDQLVGYKATKRVEDEAEAVRKITKQYPARDDSGGKAHAEYVKDCVIPRMDFMMEWVKHKMQPADETKTGLEGVERLVGDAMDAVLTEALRRLYRGVAPGASPTKATVCDSLMALATGSFEFSSIRVNLRWIRERLLWSETEPYESYTAFLYLNIESRRATATGAKSTTYDGNDKSKTAVFVPFRQTKHTLTPDGSESFTEPDVLVHCKPRPKKKDGEPAKDEGKEKSGDA